MSKLTLAALSVLAAQHGMTIKPSRKNGGRYAVVKGSATITGLSNLDDVEAVINTEKANIKLPKADDFTFTDLHNDGLYAVTQNGSFIGKVQRLGGKWHAVKLGRPIRHEDRLDAARDLLAPAKVA